MAVGHVLDREAARPDSDLVPEVLLQYGTKVELKPRRTLALGHGADKSAFVLIEGMAILEWKPTQHRRRILELFYPGAVITATCLPPLPDSKIIAATACKLLRLSATDLKHQMCRDEIVFEYCCTDCFNHRARLAVHIGALGGLTSEHRVAELFVELSLRLRTTPSGKNVFDLPLSRNDIADYLALNADTLSRIMSRFRSDGILRQVGREQIYIEDWQSLLDRCQVSDALTLVHAT